MRVRRGGLASDSVEAHHADDVARHHDDMPPSFAMPATKLQGASAGLEGTRERGDAGAHGRGGLEPEAARRDGGDEGHGTDDVGHIVDVSVRHA